ncbi:MAG TPA: LuxR C-terminal-related transcriptional regulator [Gemmatimonadales bacterium]|nr:LuxR C-terminal-related transcriptional regulator [Gemmatimonadales bacterium]
MLDCWSTGGVRVVLFEDLHWADAATLDLLQLVARRLGRLRVLVVCSYRDDEIGPRHPVRALLGNLAGTSAVTRLPVELLSPAGVAELATGHGVDTEELHRVTGGNPFFVTEVLSSPIGGIPPTVGDMMAARLAGVSPSARHIVDAVAVVGSPALFAVLNRLVEADSERVHELIDAGVLRPMGEGLGFRHELARMAVLDAIPILERQAWHARVLGLLSDDPAYARDVALLAHHAEAAGDAAAVLEHAPAAGAQAVAAGAHREAAAHYARTLRFGDVMPPARRAETLECFAQASVHNGQLLDAVGAWRDAARIRGELGDRLAEGNVLRLLAYVLWPSGRASEARRVGRRAVEILEALPPSRELAWAHVTMCQLLVYDQAEFAAATEHIHRATALAQRCGDGEAASQARFHYALGRYILGHRDEGWAEMQRLARTSLDAGDVEVGAMMLMLMFIYAVMYMERARADEAYVALVGLSRDRHLQGYQLPTEMHRALGVLRGGRWDEALERIEGLVERPDLFPNPRFVGLSFLGLMRARRGKPGAWELLNEAATGIEGAGWTLVVSAARAETAWLEGDPARALAEARRGLDVCTRHTGPWITGELARWVLLASGERPAVRTEEPFSLELLGDWRRAAMAWERLGCPYDAALARLSGDVPALRQALATFRRLGAGPAAAIAATRLREQGSSGFSVREHEVIELVAAGLSNKAIAARLYLSPRTVGKHIERLLAKTNSANRAQLATHTLDQIHAPNPDPPPPRLR